MIYLDNNTEPQQVYIPRETLNLKTVTSISSDPLEDYYTKSEVDRLIADIEIPEIDLSGYATIEYVDNTIGNINNILESI